MKAKTMNKSRLLDPAFKYVPAGKTDIRKTFARIRREQAEAAKRTPANVKPLKKEPRRA